MTTFPNSPRLVKGGLALLDPQSEQVQRCPAVQPDTLSRTLQVQAARSEAARTRLAGMCCACGGCRGVAASATNRAYAEARY